MRPHQILRILAVVGIFCFCSSFAFSQTSSAEEKILLDIENQRAEALTNKNWSVLNSIYHDQFRGITTEGVVIDKKALMEILRSAQADTSFSNEEMNASIYGYAGVTSVKQIQRNKNGSIASQSRYLHVYVKRNGKWTIVEGQGTSLQP